MTDYTPEERDRELRRQAEASLAMAHVVLENVRRIIVTALGGPRLIEEGAKLDALAMTLVATLDEQRRLKDAALDHLAERTKQCQIMRRALENVVGIAATAVTASVPGV